MTVYLGDHGVVELKRASGQAVSATVQPADVSIDRRRFSFEDDVRGEFITGDQVDIRNQEKANLEFIEGHAERDWRGFVYVDIMGGLRLYNSFDAAIRGNVGEAVELVRPSLAQLCIRLTQGADFFGRFFIYTSGGADPRDSDSAVWYEAECIVTNVSITVSPTEIIESSVDFVTTGDIRLLIGHPPSYLLTEEPAKLLLESNNEGGGILLAPLD